LRASALSLAGWRLEEFSPVGAADAASVDVYVVEDGTLMQEVVAMKALMWPCDDWIGHLLSLGL
jgi:hypothetical protein